MAALNTQLVAITFHTDTLTPAGEQYDNTRSCKSEGYKLFSLEWDNTNKPYSNSISYSFDQEMHRRSRKNFLCKEKVNIILSKANIQYKQLNKKVKIKCYFVT